MNPVKPLVAAALVVLVALGMTAVATAQSDDGEKVVLTVGIPETYDSFNHMVGVEVPDFDVWNMQYVDILINNAGMIRRTPAIDFSEKDWDDVLELNAKAVFFLSQAVGRDMMNRKSGKIVNVASLLSFQGGIFVPSYAASKGAVMQLTKALANGWAQHGINVNAIAPGYMVTENTKALREDPIRSKSILDRIPAGRWGEPTDLQGAAVFLSSPASDYVNGHEFSW